MEGSELSCPWGRLVSPLGMGEAGPLLHHRLTSRSVNGTWSPGPQFHPLTLRFNQSWVSTVR